MYAQKTRVIIILFKVDVHLDTIVIHIPPIFPLNKSKHWRRIFDAVFEKEANTFEKWMFIEGILRTLKENGIPVQQVQFLRLRVPLNDPHLDFSKAWPIQGFMSS